MDCIYCDRTLALYREAASQVDKLHRVLVFAKVPMLFVGSPHNKLTRQEYIGQWCKMPGVGGPFESLQRTFSNSNSNSNFALWIQIIWIVSNKLGNFKLFSMINIWSFFCEIPMRGLIQYKDVILPYRKSHCGDKTVVRSSSLHNGISYTDMYFILNQGPGECHNTSLIISQHWFR